MLLQVLLPAVLLFSTPYTYASTESPEEQEVLPDEDVTSWHGPISCEAKRIEYSLDGSIPTDDFEDMFFCDDGVDRHEIVGLPEELLEQLNARGHPLPLIGEDVLLEEGRFGKRVDFSKGSVSIDEERRLDTDNYYAISVTKGIRKVIAIRVTTIDASVTATSASLADAIFGTSPNSPPNLLTQIDQCSYSLLTVVPATEYNMTSMNGVDSGVLDVTINQVSAGYDAPHITNAARAAARRLVDLDSYDHVMYCLPSGSTFTPKGSTTGVTTWLSYGEMAGSESVYNNASCSSLSEQMYQMGLNLGLRNANKEQLSRGDATGYMGLSSKTTLQKCYNAYNLYRLGWYANRVKSSYIKRWTSYVENKNGNGDADGRVFNLVPISDYKLSSRYHTVVGKIILPRMTGALYLLYNGAKDFNVGTETTTDKVSIVWGTWGQQSVLIGTIGAGDTFTWDAYMGGLEALRIKCVSIVKTGVPDTATVTVTLRP